MALFDVFNIAGSGMSAESVRLNTVASNLANADSVSSSPTSAYKARYPVFQAIQSSLMSAGPGAGAGTDPTQAADASVQVSGIVESTAASGIVAPATSASVNVAETVSPAPVVSRTSVRLATGR